MHFTHNMALFGFLKKNKRRRVGQLKPNQKVDYQPKVNYIPKKHTTKRVSKNSLRLQRVGFKWKPILATIVGLTVIIVFGYLLSRLFASESLQIKNFEMMGNRTINDAQVLAVLDKYRLQSIFTVDANAIEADLQSEFNIFNGVWVSKYYPDTLSIRISEREPRLVYINLSGAFLVDANGQVLRKIFVDPAVMPEEKLNIARGFGDPNSTYLYEIFLNEFKISNQILDLPTEEQKLLIATAFKYEEISQTERLNRVKQLELQYKTELIEIWNKINQAVDISVYSTYPRVDAIDTVVYDEDLLIDIARLKITGDLFNLFSARKIQISRVIWEGELLIRVVLNDGKELVFSSVRKITEQFEDYTLVKSQLQKEGRDYCQIDLSATKIAVKFCR